MSGTAFTPGQMAEFQSTVSVSVATALPKVAAKFNNPKFVLKAIKDKNQVLADRVTDAIEQAVRSMFVLVRSKQLSVTISGGVDLSFYANRKNIWVGKEFRQLVLAKAKPIKPGTIFKVNIDDLQDDLADDEIEEGLPERHCFDESTLCAVIAELVSEQANGVSGDLLNNGLSNIFYIGSYRGDVYWNQVDKIWAANIYTWKMERNTSNGHDTGDRVLSPAK